MTPDGLDHGVCVKFTCEIALAGEGQFGFCGTYFGHFGACVNYHALFGQCVG